MPRVLILLALLAPYTIAPVLAADSDLYLQELTEQAHTENLAGSRQWRALVHYRKNLIFSGVTGQAVPELFLVPVLMRSGSHVRPFLVAFKRCGY